MRNARGLHDKNSSTRSIAGMNPAIAALLCGATCIALSPIFVRLSETGPTASAFWRVALAVPALWAVCLAREKGFAPPYAGRRLLLGAAGLAFAGDLAFWHLSIQHTSVANATLLANLATLFVTVGAWLFLREKPTALFAAGLIGALGGVVLLVTSSASGSRGALLGDALGIVTAMFYAAYIFAVKGLRDRGEQTLRLMAVSSTMTAALLLPVAIVSGERMLPESAYGWSVLLGLALISHAGGQGLIAYALAHLPASFSSVSLLLQPVMAAIFAWAILGESLAPPQIAGGAMVLAGIYLARRGSS